jgi:hypothetical protein
MKVGQSDQSSAQDFALHTERRLAALRVLWLTLAFAARTVSAQDVWDPKELLRNLNQASVDPAEVYVLRNAQITRDRVNLYFNRGFIGFFGPVAGEVTGAIFVGDGEILLVPPDAVERQSLAHFTGSPILAEQFSWAYLRFTDQSASELRALARRPEPEDFEQPGDFAERWTPVARRLSAISSVRLLMDLLGARDRPYFLAHVQGVHLGMFQVEVDERSPEAVRVVAVQRQARGVYSDVWCSFPSRNSARHARELAVGSVRFASSKIDTRIHSDYSMETHAELELESRSNQERVLVFELARALNLVAVTAEDGQAIPALEDTSLEESEAAARGNDWIVVALPSPQPVGKRFRLNFRYQGNVITEVGNGVFCVGARGSWYPSRGPTSFARFDLTFHYPEQLTLIATGNRVQETAAEGWKTSRWVSEGTIPVAGFNLGTYRSRTRHVGQTVMEVHATRAVEESLEQRHAAVSTPSDGPIRQPGTRWPLLESIPRPVVPLTPAALLDRMADDAANALRFFETLFGPFPYPYLAVSQAPGHFGQGWPGLVYLPTLSFLTEADRTRLGYRGKTGEDDAQLSVAHEIAHQWWGNMVGWASYRDQWLSEGFATYAAALYLTRDKDGERKFRALLRSYRDDLLAKISEGSTVEAGGPICLGQRLGNSRNPAGYQNIIYKKSCWVIHMLRALMTDSRTASDERFFQMLRDFLNSYRGQNASTENFIRHAEKYMTRTLDLEGNRRLDWFFANWVFGTGIPTYTLEVTTQPLATRQFVIQGKITASNVPAPFEMPVPVVAVDRADQKALLGWVVVGESGGHFRFTTPTKPAKITIDDDRILAVVQ